MNVQSGLHFFLYFFGFMGFNYYYLLLGPDRCLGASEEHEHVAVC